MFVHINMVCIVAFKNIIVHGRIEYDQFLNRYIKYPEVNLLSSIIFGQSAHISNSN